MPNIASAKKNMRKSRAATVRNRAQRSALRTALKKAKLRAPPRGEAGRGQAPRPRGAQGPHPQERRAQQEQAESRRRVIDAQQRKKGDENSRRPFAVGVIRDVHPDGCCSDRRICSVLLQRGQLRTAALAVPLGGIVHRAALVALERLRLFGRPRAQRDRLVSVTFAASGFSADALTVAGLDEPASSDSAARSSRTSAASDGSAQRAI